MFCAYDGKGIIIQNNLHGRHQILSDFWFSPNRNFTCDVYANDSLHGVCFPTVLVLVKPRKRWTDDRLGQTVTRLETTDTTFCLIIRLMLYPTFFQPVNRCLQ